MRIDTVLFDLDGTLLDTNELVISSFQHVYKTILGKEKPVEHIVRSFGEPLAATMEREFDIPVSEAIKIYREYHYEKFEDLIGIFPGVEEAIRELHSKGYKLGVVTSRLTNTTLRGLRKYDLEKYFGCIVTADDTKAHKPDPEPVNLALEKLNSKSGNTLMIGDSIFDVKCAKNAGVLSAAVSWSMTGEEEFEREKPDYIIYKAEEIVALPENLNKA